MKFIFLIPFFLAVGVWISAMTAVSVMFLAEGAGGALATWLAERGWDRVMRRCILGWAVIFLVLFLKRVGWHGWKDAGFTTNDPEWSLCSRWALVRKGVWFGLITLGAVTVLNMLLGVRSISPVNGGVLLLYRVLKYIVSGVFVALIEETICRGILFRLLARLWYVWPAAVIMSVLFSLAHFFSPAPESFHGDSFFSISMQVFVSTFAMVPKEPGFILRFVNLALLGVVLCAFVIRTKTIWFGVGVHAAWVWVIKINTFFTDSVPGSRITPWLGKRGDFTDSIMTTAVLAGLATWTLSRSVHPNVVVRWKGLHWHMAPHDQNNLKAWLDRYFETGNRLGSRVLKEHDGCRVTVQDGCVLKEYAPRSGWKAVRFAIRPSRARRAFILARKLIDIGVPVPEPVAWAVRRKFCFIRVAYAITREIDKAEQLTFWLERNIQNQTAGVKVMASYGRLMAMFHRKGYYNRDFKHENVLCSSEFSARLWVVDLDGVSRKYWITRRRAERDLMRVGRSLAELGWSREQDISAFFRAYNEGVPSRLQTSRFPP